MILVLTGPVRSGKTTFLRALLPDLQALRVPIRGYVSPAVITDGKTTGYDLFDIRSGRSIPLLRIAGEAGWEKVGPYRFLPGGLEAASSTILSSRPGVLLIVDEVGPAELSGRGVWPALLKALARPSLNFLLVVRKALLDDLRRQLGNRRVDVFDFAGKDVSSALLKKLSKSRPVATARKARPKV